MQHWTVTDTASGAVLMPCLAPIVPDQPPQADDGFDADTMTAHAIDGPFDPALCEWTGAAWVPSVAVLKARKLDAVNARRLIAEAAGCNTPFGVVDSDERSRGLISGAALMAVIAKGAGAPFSESWTMHDNSQVTLDADGMVAMGATVGAYISATHARGVELKAEVDAAADTEVLAAIDIDTGWPS